MSAPLYGVITSLAPLAKRRGARVRLLRGRGARSARQIQIAKTRRSRTRRPDLRETELSTRTTDMADNSASAAPVPWSNGTSRVVTPTSRIRIRHQRRRKAAERKTDKCEVSATDLPRHCSDFCYFNIPPLQLFLLFQHMFILIVPFNYVLNLKSGGI